MTNPPSSQHPAFALDRRQTRTRVYRIEELDSSPFIDGCIHEDFTLQGYQVVNILSPEAKVVTVFGLWNPSLMQMVEQAKEAHRTSGFKVHQDDKETPNEADVTPNEDDTLPIPEAD
jgi:hypothetical protein